MGPSAMIDGEKFGFETFAPHQRRQVAVHVVEGWKAQKRLPVENLEAAPGIGGAILQEP